LLVLSSSMYINGSYQLWACYCVELCDGHIICRHACATTRCGTYHLLTLIMFQLHCKIYFVMYAGEAFGLNSSSFDQEWTSLSGGEKQVLQVVALTTSIDCTCAITIVNCHIPRLYCSDWSPVCAAIYYAVCYCKRCCTLQLNCAYAALGSFSVSIS
jgi:hypothetical protein